MLIRGVKRRCPRCGQGGLFEGWFKLTPTCPNCHLRFEREEGAFLGSLTINYTLSGILGVVVMVIWFALTLPDTEIIPMMIGVIGIVLASIPFFYPFAKTTWAAIDLLSNRHDGDKMEESR